MKKRLLFLIAVIISVLAFAITAGAIELNIGVQLDNGVTIRAVDDIIYLPSYIDLTSVKITYTNNEYPVTLDSAPFESGTAVDLTKYKRVSTENNTPYYELMLVATGSVVPRDKVYIYQADSLDAIFIDTSIGFDSLLDNVTDKSAGVSIISKDGSSFVNQQNVEVRTRGNTTPTYMKKPFQLKFEQKIDLYGMGKAKTWVLLANYLDQSYIRNSIMYRLAKLLGMGASDFKNVDIYIDGVYQGVYLLCEKVNINSNRVDIYELENDNESLNPDYGDALMSKTETIYKSEDASQNPAILNETIIIEYKYVKDLVNPADITGGYLIELDNNNKDNRYQFGSYFITKTEFGENLYVIKSPEYCSKEQVEYIARLFAEMEEAMASSNGKNSLGKHYTEYCDLDSFAIAYIMAELGRNYDVGGASVYFNKDKDINGETSKIVKGPLWDCDNVLGNIHRGDAQVQTTMWATKGSPWKMLTRHADFNARVKEKYEIAYDLVYDMLDKDGFIDEQIRDIGSSAIMDRLLFKQDQDGCWPLYADGSLHWFNQKGTAFPYYYKYTDYINNSRDTAVGYLCLTLQQRAEYLRTVWGCDVAKRTRVLNTLEPVAPEAPNQPTTPDTPSTPSVPDTPSNPEAPSTPTMPEAPSNPTTPSEPTIPETPSADEPATSTNLFTRIVELILSFFEKLMQMIFSL